MLLNKFTKKAPQYKRKPDLLEFMCQNCKRVVFTCHLPKYMEMVEFQIKYFETLFMFCKRECYEDFLEEEGYIDSTVGPYG